MPENKTDSEFESAFRAGVASAALRTIDFDLKGAPVLVVPVGFELKTPDFDKMEKWLPTPTRKRGNFSFGDIASFDRYFNEHKTPDARIFANVSDTGGSFKGILDFHGGKPSFNEHTCNHALISTLEWRLWIESNGKWMSQVDFASFLEEHSDWFAEPKGAPLLELVKSLEGHSNVSINSAVKLQTGAIKLAYDEQVEIKGSTTTQAGEMTIPQILEVGIAPFHGIAPYRLKARLRYKIENRKIVFSYHTIDAHLAVRDVCKKIMVEIKEKTGVEPFIS